MSRFMKTGVKTNRLSSEKSPYLQQHATNPVNWYVKYHRKSSCNTYQIIVIDKEILSNVKVSMGPRSICFSKEGEQTYIFVR